MVDAATVCATTPARELGLVGHGRAGRVTRLADFVVLDDRLSVVQTYVAGQLVYARSRVMGLAIPPAGPRHSRPGTGVSSPYSRAFAVRMPHFEKRVVTLAALAADAAMDSRSGLMHDSVSCSGTPSCRPASDDLRLAPIRRTARRSRSGCARPKRERVRHRGAKRGGRVGERVVRERAEHEPIDAGGGAVHASLPNRTTLRPGRYTSSSGVWYAGGRPSTAQWPGRVDVAHVDGQVTRAAARGRAAARPRAVRGPRVCSAASHARPTLT